MFESAKMKIRRAEVHKNEYLRAETQYMMRNPYSLVAETDPTTGEKKLSIKIRESVPQDFALYIGDVIHNLRTALDHTITELSVQHGGDFKRTSFPFAEDEKTFNELLKKRDIAIVGGAALSVVRAYMPYRTGNPILFLLHELDNIDKHRNILPVYGHPVIPSLEAYLITPDGERKEIPGPRTLTKERANHIKDGDEFRAIPVLVLAPGLPLAGKSISLMFIELFKIVATIVSKLESIE